MKNPKFVPPYWDDQPKFRQYRWYKKREWKRLLRKKWIKDRLKEDEN